MSELDKNVDHPQHYLNAKVHMDLDFEPIDLCENYNFCIGNALKYVLRADFKGKRLEDLMKADWYLHRELEALEQDPDNWVSPKDFNRYLYKAFRESNHFVALILNENGYYTVESLSKAIEAIEDYVTEHERVANSEKLFESIETEKDLPYA